MSSAADSARVQSLVGQVIDGRYRVDSVLAMGGMGAVLRGTHLVLGQGVAIRVMLDATMRDPTMRERVFREARIPELAEGDLCHGGMVHSEVGGPPAT